MQINHFFGRVGRSETQTVFNATTTTETRTAAAPETGTPADDMHLPELAKMERKRAEKRKMPCGPRGRTTAERKTKQTGTWYFRGTEVTQISRSELQKISKSIHNCSAKHARRSCQT